MTGAPADAAPLGARGVGLVVVGFLAGLFYSNFLIDYLLPGELDPWVVVSDLEAEGARHATLLRATEVVAGLLVLLLLPHVRAALPAGRWRAAVVWLTATFAIGNALAGMVQLPCQSGVSGCDSTAEQLQRVGHDAFSIVSAVALFLGALAATRLTRDSGPVWFHRAAWFAFWIGGLVATGVFTFYGAQDSTSWQTGASQRFQLLVSSGWIVCLAVYAARSEAAAG